jgi:hypothetical protein
MLLTACNDAFVLQVAVQLLCKGQGCAVFVCLYCRRVLQQIVAGSRWVPGLSTLAEFAFSMIEGMQSYYTYVES